MESIRSQVSKNSDGGFMLKDANIYMSDLKTLNDGECVNDMVIHYYLRILELQYHTEQQPKTIQFIMPCTIQFIQAFPIEIVKESLSNDFFEGFRYFILPLSNFNTESLSSSHWSLLIVLRNAQSLEFYHYDSLAQSNSSAARELATKIANILSIENYNYKGINSNSQINSYDCGVYVMAYVKAFLDSKYDITKVTEGITPEKIYNFRHQIKQDILKTFPK